MLSSHIGNTVRLPQGERVSFDAPGKCVCCLWVNRNSTPVMPHTHRERERRTGTKRYPVTYSSCHAVTSTSSEPGSLPRALCFNLPITQETHTHTQRHTRAYMCVMCSGVCAVRVYTCVDCMGGCVCICVYIYVCVCTKLIYCLIYILYRRLPSLRKDKWLVQHHTACADTGDNTWIQVSNPKAQALTYPRNPKHPDFTLGNKLLER